MLNRISIKNYRSCLDTSLELHPQLSVLIGPNGSGKTNILQAIMLLHKLAQEDSGNRRRSRSEGITSGIEAQFLLDHTAASLDASINVYPDELNRDVLSSSRQTWQLKSRNGRKLSSHLPLGLSDELSGRADYYTYLKFMRYQGAEKLEPKPPKWAVKVLETVGKFCGGIRYYGASQFTNPGTCPTSFSIDEDARVTSTYGLLGHRGILRKLYYASKDQSKDNFSQFIDIVGKNGLGLIDGLQFEEVPVSSVDYTVRVGGKLVERKKSRLLIIPRFQIGRSILSPNQLSEGTFKTLALLFHVITDTSSLLLVEEPEVCVHHGLLSSILEIIKSSSEMKQIVISTHSDYVLDHVKPENVLRITRNRETGTIARRLTDALNAREYSALRDYLASSGNLGEYWREGGLGDRP